MSQDLAGRTRSVVASQRAETITLGSMLKVTAYPWGVEFEVLDGEDQK